MSRPILFPSTEKDFLTQGLGVLTDAISCEVTEERNGAFELTMVYPVTGMHYGEICDRCIILAPPNPSDEWQPFRIYRITRPMRGKVTVYGEHISYDLNGKTVLPFVAFSPQEAAEALVANAQPAHDFTFSSDIYSENSLTVKVPSGIRSVLGGQEDSMLDVYKGEYKFDRFHVSLLAARGEDRGATIRYGKNLTDITQDRNISEMYTHVFPFWSNSDGDKVIYLPECTIPVPGEFDHQRDFHLDLSADFEEEPTEDEMRAYTEAYIAENNLGVPRVSITASFIQLEQSIEYKDLLPVELVRLCDIVHVHYEKLGVDTTAKVIKTVYDVLLDRYDHVEIGDPKYSLTDTLSNQAVAGTNNGKNIHILQQQIQGSNIVFYDFHNRSNVTVGQSETQVASVTIVTTKSTTALLVAEALLNVTAAKESRTIEATIPAVDEEGNETTQALQLTFQEDAPVQLNVRFYINGELIADWAPQGTFGAGRHVLPLYYCFKDLPANHVGNVSIRMEASSGSVSFDMGQLRGVVFAQHLAAGVIWDGTITVEEVVAPFLMRSRMNLAAFTEEVGAGMQIPTPAAISEVVSAFSMRSRMSLVGFSEEISMVHPVVQNTITPAEEDMVEWSYNDRYVEVGENGLQLRTAWEYQSAEEAIDSGRMTVVKAVTSDLASVESLEVANID